MDNNPNSEPLVEWLFDEVLNGMPSDENKADINKEIKRFDIYVSSKVQKCGRDMRIFRVKHFHLLIRVGVVNQNSYAEDPPYAEDPSIWEVPDPVSRSG